MHPWDGKNPGKFFFVLAALTKQKGGFFAAQIFQVLGIYGLSFEACLGSLSQMNPCISIY